jgi:hypothetical protein
MDDLEKEFLLDEPETGDEVADTEEEEEEVEGEDLGLDEEV